MNIKKFEVTVFQKILKVENSQPGAALEFSSENSTGKADFVIYTLCLYSGPDHCAFKYSLKIQGDSINSG